ncbi:hypothetical protein ACFQVC_23990 [Streptomyces monticola]|uniref:Uncharacterized protein n=1 Tax=Streptomyces monticola TaxID=2666263 RepID=A0ABW2JNA8_9ACTN
MRAEHDGLCVEYDGPGPGPDGALVLTAAVSPPDAANQVEVRYRAGEGELRTVRARWLRNGPGGLAQYFRAVLTGLRPGDTVRYTVVCRCAGRQVPAEEDAARLDGTHRIPGGAAPPPAAPAGASSPGTAVPGTAPASTSEGRCGHTLPVSAALRQFDFGQFVLLYHQVRAGGRMRSVPVVLTLEDTIEVPAGRDLIGHLGGVPLEMLLNGNYPGHPAVIAKARTRQVVFDTFDAIRKAVESGVLTAAGAQYAAALQPDRVERLFTGQEVTLLARKLTEDGSPGAPETVTLRAEIQKVALPEAALDRAIAERTWQGAELMEDQVAALVRGEPTVIADGAQRLVQLMPDRAAAVPATNRFTVTDIAAFLGHQLVPGTGGTAVPVELSREAVTLLRSGRPVQAVAGGERVELQPSAGADSAAAGGSAANGGAPNGFIEGGVRTLASMRHDSQGTSAGKTGGAKSGGQSGGEKKPQGVESGGQSGATTIGPATGTADAVTTGSSPPPGGTPLPGAQQETAADDDPTAPPKPQALSVAVYLPWRQSWSLDGLTKGSLLSTIALAPGEETLLNVSSWEHRSKALEQSTETETEQQFDYTSTTRDTDDVFSETVSKNDFQAQVGANLDASYSTGVASISVGVNGSLTSASSLQETVRTTNQHLQEATYKASTRVRSRRVTRITETREQGSTSQVTRTIRNPNECRTLTLDFHEVLAHYTIRTAFRADRVRMVVLVPNPVTVRAFSPLFIRKNETALRQALLDPALAPGFEALRLLTSYKFAYDELVKQATEQAKNAELERERKPPLQVPPPEPASAEKQALLDALASVAQAADALAKGRMDPALKRIGAHKSVDPAVRQSGQRWLYWKLLQRKLPPGLISALTGIAGKPASVLTVDDARAVQDGMPQTGSSAASLTSLGELSDQEKEDAGLAALIKSQPGYGPFDWGTFWYPRVKDGRLYDVDDAGLAVRADRLREAFLRWEGKAAAGGGQLEAQQALKDAELKQDEATVADKLEMKYGLENVCDGRERAETLQAHLEDHRDYYRYVLFQALPPSEQLALLMQAAPQLSVGMFEPHVVAMNGGDLAVPLTPLGESTLARLVGDIRRSLGEAGEQAADAASRMPPDTVILPTPGVTVETSLGDCTGCDEHTEQMRAAELEAALARARLLRLEGDLRQARLCADPPDLTPLYPHFPGHADGRTAAPAEDLHG